MSTRLVVVRHGETHWNVVSRIQGHADSPLTAAGEAQAAAIAARLATERFDRLVSSDLGLANLNLTAAGGCMGTLDRHLSAGGTLDDATWRRAMLTGTVMASFVVEAFSFDRMQVLTPGEVKARAHELQRMTTVDGAVTFKG